MRNILAPTVLLAIASMASAEAQGAESVSVNPIGARVLYDPGMGQERVLPPLLMPGDEAPIRLRPPHRRPTSKTPSETAAPRSAVAAPVETAAPAEVTAPPVRKPRHRVAAPPPPPPQAAAQGRPASGLADLSDLVTAPVQSIAAPPRRQPAPASPKPRVEKQQSTVAETRAAKPRASAGSTRDSITFVANASDPSTAAVSMLRTLAGSLNNALADASARVQLKAYAGARGEKTSDTRRLALKRALVIRQLLIDDGVPAERIDVLALGGTEDNGPLDRVDIVIRN